MARLGGPLMSSGIPNKSLNSSRKAILSVSVNMYPFNPLHFRPSAFLITARRTSSDNRSDHAFARFGN